MSGAIDFDRINSAAMARLPDLLHAWLPGGRLGGVEYTCGSLAGGQGDSCKVNVQTGRWSDFATGEKGGDPVDLFAAINNMGQGEAAKELARELGVGNGSGSRAKPRKKADDWRPIIPVPADAPPPPAHHYKHGAASKAWEYLDADGQLLGRVLRFDTQDGKQVLPQTFCAGPDGKRSWRFKAMPEPRPLYGLDRLAQAPDAPVLVCEGEKAADAAQGLAGESMVCVTWPGGSKAVAKADLTPLAGRRVCIWPDADRPGFAAGIAVAKETSAALVVPDESWPEAWDLADADGWDRGRLLREIESRQVGLGTFLEVARDRYEIGRGEGVGQEQDTTKEPLPAPPLDVFPERLQNVLLAASEAFCVPLAVAIACLLALASACVGRSRGIIAKAGWVEYANLFLALVADSGVGKSPCAKAIFSAFYRVEAKLFKAWQEAAAKHLEKMNAHYAASKSKKKDAPDLGPAPEKPKRKQLYVDDATIESLTDALAENPRGVLWHRDELAGLLMDMDKYSGKEGATKTRLLSAYDSGPWKNSRVNEKRCSFIPHACLSLFGTVQPGVLPSLFGNQDGVSGFLPRFNFIVAEQDRPALWTDAVFGDEHKRELDRITETLLSLDLKDNKPVVFGIVHEAKRIYIEWFNDQAMSAWAGVGGDDLKALRAKLRAQCLRLALILHLLEAVADGVDPDLAGPVQEPTMRRAIALADWLLAHQLHVWRIIMSGKADASSPLDRRVAQAIISLEGEILNGMLRTSRVAEKLNEGVDERFHVGVRAVGQAYTKLKLTTRHLPDKSARGVVVDGPVLEKLRKLCPNNVRNVLDVPNQGAPTVEGGGRFQNTTSGGSSPGGRSGHSQKTTSGHGNPHETRVPDVPDVLDVLQGTKSSFPHEVEV